MWAHLMGVQDRVKYAIKMQKKPTPTCDDPPRKPKTQNWKFFFWLGTSRLAESVEGLNTSLAAAAGEL